MDLRKESSERVESVRRTKRIPPRSAAIIFTKTNDVSHLKNIFEFIKDPSLVKEGVVTNIEYNGEVHEIKIMKISAGGQVGAYDVVNTQLELLDENIAGEDDCIPEARKQQSKKKTESNKEPPKVGRPSKKVMMSTSNEKVKNMLSLHKKHYTDPTIMHKVSGQDNVQINAIDFSNLLFENEPIEKQNSPTVMAMPRRNLELMSTSSSLSSSNCKRVKNNTATEAAKSLNSAAGTSRKNDASSNSKLANSKTYKSSQPEPQQKKNTLMVEVFELSGVYIKSTQLVDSLMKSTTPSELARNVLKHVVDEETLRMTSAKGSKQKKTGMKAVGADIITAVQDLCNSHFPNQKMANVVEIYNALASNARRDHKMKNGHYEELQKLKEDGQVPDKGPKRKRKTPIVQQKNIRKKPATSTVTSEDRPLSAADNLQTDEVSHQIESRKSPEMSSPLEHANGHYGLEQSHGLFEEVEDSSSSDAFEKPSQGTKKSCPPLSLVLEKSRCVTESLSEHLPPFNSPYEPVFVSPAPYYATLSGNYTHLDESSNKQSTNGAVVPCTNGAVPWPNSAVSWSNSAVQCPNNTVSFTNSVVPCTNNAVSDVLANSPDMLAYMSTPMFQKALKMHQQMHSS